MKVLIADDDKNLRKVLLNELSEERFEVSGVENGFKAVELLEKFEFDISVLDLNMPGLGGMEVLKKVRASEIPVEIIILTGYATIATAIEAMKLGAYDYLTKPFKTGELVAVIEKAYEKKRLAHENRLLRFQVRRQSEAQKIITRSPLLLGIMENLKKFALSELPVLIVGESGVGKELIAKAIHRNSKRADGPFIPINCGAIHENMLESELFGHEKGAFTSAHAKKPGLLEVADHGTLFLDEIGELNPQLQTKLLRVIETGSFFRVGGTNEVRVDVKYISATNKDIKKEVERGSFRQDLYYRISGLNLQIPPLRERREDIPLLIEEMIESHSDFKHKSFSQEALKILLDYPWPGNVRELQNTVHRTLLLSKNEKIEPDDLPLDLIADHKVTSKRLEDIERDHILRVLREVGGQKGKAAEILGVDPKTLYRKLLSYGVRE
jgi:two-component system NtrC family response regulator/two-component system response regulator AtoC